MPRRRVAAKREIIPDPKFGSEILARYINVVMVDGKKAVAEKIVYGALESAMEKIMAERKSKKDDESDAGEAGSDNLHTLSGATPAERALRMFEIILANIRPNVEVRSRRVGGATYQIPVEVRQDRGVALAMRWLVTASRSRGEKGMMRRMSGEMIDAFNNRGSAIKKREDTHKMAKANLAFAHFRWN